MLLPYRVKNPPERFPAATLTLIALNLLVFALTTDGFVIRESVVNSYAFTLGSAPLWSTVSAAFLHGDPFHILGNMLMLWIFGPSVEGRLRAPRYLLLYFLTGFGGNILQSSMAGAVPIIGASGSIMGVMGAFWFLFAWSPVCIFYWFYIFWRGTFEVAAQWVIAAYIVLDMADGVLSGAAGVRGGVASFAHVGGAVAGVAMCIAMRAKRDSLELSEAKAVHAEMKDLSTLPLSALLTMMDEDAHNPEVIRAAIKQAIAGGQASIVNELMAKAGPTLLDKDPALVGHYLLNMNGDPRIYQPVHLLRVAGSLERGQAVQQAMSLYYYIIRHYPASPDVEMAFYRMAGCYWKVYKDAGNARKCLEEMARRYPAGALRPYAQALIREMGNGG